MRVREIMRREARFCHPWTPLAETGRTMAEVGCGALPVVDLEQNVIGMVTDRDICLALTAGDRKASEVAVREVIHGDVLSCEAGDDIGDALAIMATCHVRRLAVLDAAGHLDGILSLDDVAVASRALGPHDYTGPFYSDVAKTLKAICGHALPAVC
ncbi:MAG TPA: CBS domain-containing protein [Thermoanaerobaculia bacterium]|jgi:CBS domain-containing protein